jgi:hypothetical protein
MEAHLATAAALLLIGAVIHGFAGEYWIFSVLRNGSLPSTPLGNSNATERMLRVSWHFVTANFLGSAIVLVAVASSRLHTISGVTARIVSLQIAAYVFVGCVLAIRRVKDLIRAPQLILLAIIAILSWWWAP